MTYIWDTVSYESILENCSTVARKIAVARGEKKRNNHGNQLSEGKKKVFEKVW